VVVDVVKEAARVQRIGLDLGCCRMGNLFAIFDGRQQSQVDRTKKRQGVPEKKSPIGVCGEYLVRGAGYGGSY
jgi:hypothetical protein